MVYVVVPVFNRWTLTSRCLESLQSSKITEELSIYVVDDGSTDGTSDNLKEQFPSVRIIEGTGSLFWGGAVDLALEVILPLCISGDVIITVNNDISVPEYVLQSLSDILKSDGSIGLASALTIESVIEDKTSYSNEYRVKKSGSIFESRLFNLTRHPFVGLSPYVAADMNPVECDLLTARCLAHNVDCILSVGGYAAEDFPHYGCDDDFSYRVRRFGYKCLLIPSLQVVSLESEGGGALGRVGIVEHLLGTRSSSNIRNKFLFSFRNFPFYIAPFFFFFGVLKAIILYLRSQ